MRLLLSILLLSTSLLALADKVRVESFRYWTAKDHMRVVLDTSDTVSHRIFRLNDPERLVIDLKNADPKVSLARVADSNPYIKRFRTGKRKGGYLRLVVDLKMPVRPKSFTLAPNSQYGHRLVVDLHPYQRHEKPKAYQSVVKRHKGSGTDIIIAVDAGHGGRDPGALGRRGTQEKTVTLKIAKSLAKKINREKGMRAVLVRKGDEYINLRKRMKIARDHGAHLFVSIHADSFQNKAAKGASVFILDSKGASREAQRWMQVKNKNKELVGGVSLDDKEPLLRKVLIGLSQSATRQASNEAANHVIRQIRKVVKLHSHRIKRKSYLVLKSVDIPSILVETAFISNPEEERKLNSHRYQKQMASAITRGIRNYFYSRPPAGSKIAQMKYNSAMRGNATHQSKNLSSVSSTRLSQNEAGDQRVRVPR